MTEDWEEQTMTDFIEEHKVEEKQTVKENRKENLFYNEDLQNNNFQFIPKHDRAKANPPRNDQKKASRLQNSAIMEMFDSGKGRKFELKETKILNYNFSWKSQIEPRIWNSECLFIDRL